MSFCEFTVDVRPTPKGRPRFNRVTGNVYTDDTTAAYEARIRVAARQAMRGRKATTAPVELWVSFSQTDARAADTDNLVKAVSDAIQRVVFRDDRQVSVLHAERTIRADANRVDVRVTEVAA